MGMRHRTQPVPVSVPGPNGTQDTTSRWRRENYKNWIWFQEGSDKNFSATTGPPIRTRGAPRGPQGCDVDRTLVRLHSLPADQISLAVRRASQSMTNEGGLKRCKD